MSGFWKRCRIWGKPFSPACYSRQGSIWSAWKARGVSVKEGWGRQPRCLTTWLFAQGNCLFSLQDSLGQWGPADLAFGSQPARPKQGGRVGCALTDCPWLIEGKILCIFLDKCQSGCVNIRTIFKKIQRNIFFAKSDYFKCFTNLPL